MDNMEFLEEEWFYDIYRWFCVGYEEDFPF